jgi:hypothetical protein
MVNYQWKTNISSNYDQEPFQKLAAIFCRFDNTTTREERLKVDKLAAIRDSWTMFLARLQICYTPGGSLTVDEQLIPTRGRCNFRQYIPSKPGKYEDLVVL